MKKKKLQITEKICKVKKIQKLLFSKPQKLFRYLLLCLLCSCKVFWGTNISGYTSHLKTLWVSKMWSMLVVLSQDLKLMASCFTAGTLKRHSCEYGSTSSHCGYCFPLRKQIVLPSRTNTDKENSRLWVCILFPCAVEHYISRLCVRAGCAQPLVRSKVCSVFLESEDTWGTHPSRASCISSRIGFCGGGGGHVDCGFFSATFHLCFDVSSLLTPAQCQPLQRGAEGCHSLEISESHRLNALLLPLVKIALNSSKHYSSQASPAPVPSSAGPYKVQVTADWLGPVCLGLKPAISLVHTTL